MSIFHVCVHISSCNIIQYLFGCTCLRCKLAIIISLIVIRIIIVLVVVVIVVVVTIMMTIIMFMYLCPSVCTHTHTHVSILIRTPTKFFCRSPQAVPHGNGLPDNSQRHWSNWSFHCQRHLKPWLGGNVSSGGHLFLRIERCNPNMSNILINLSFSVSVWGLQTMVIMTMVGQSPASRNWLLEMGKSEPWMDLLENMYTVSIYIYIYG